MAQRIIMKRTAVPGVEPNPLVDLSEGEIGVNVADGRLWVRSSNTTPGESLPNTVVEIGGIEPGSRIKTAIDDAIDAFALTVPGISASSLNTSQFTSLGLDVAYNRTTSGSSEVGFYNGAGEHAWYAKIKRDAGGSGSFVVENTGTGNLQLVSGGHALTINPSGVGVDAIPTLGSAIFQVSDKLIVKPAGGVTVRADASPLVSVIDYQITGGTTRFALQREVVNEEGIDVERMVLRSHTGVLRLVGGNSTAFGLDVGVGLITSNQNHRFTSVVSLAHSQTPSHFELLNTTTALPTNGGYNINGFWVDETSQSAYIRNRDKGMQLMLTRDAFSNSEKRWFEFSDQAFSRTTIPYESALLMRVRSPNVTRSTTELQRPLSGVVDAANTPIAMVVLQFNLSGTVTVVGGYGVASCQRDGVGRYRLNFTQPMPSMSYYATFTYSSPTPEHGIHVQENLRPAAYGQAAKSVSGFPFTTGDNQVDQLIDIGGYTNSGISPIILVSVYTVYGIWG